MEQIDQLIQQDEWKHEKEKIVKSFEIKPYGGICYGSPWCEQNEKCCCEEYDKQEIEKNALYLKSKLNIADMCGLVFTGEYDDGEPVFIGTDQQRKMYKEAIERENLE